MQSYKKFLDPIAQILLKSGMAIFEEKSQIEEEAIRTLWPMKSGYLHPKEPDAWNCIVRPETHLQPRISTNMCNEVLN